MDKRTFLQASAAAGATALAAGHGPASAQLAPKAARGPVLLTVSGRIGAGNRGALDPTQDLLLARQQVRFDKAHAFDFAALTALPAVSITPTLERGMGLRELRGPLLTDVLQTAGAQVGEATTLLVRAIDGYAVKLPLAEVRRRRFIVATHYEGRPLALGGVGPLWVVFDADRFADMAAKPVDERFALCPWAAYHIDVQVG